jgi:ATP-dependent Clp protease adapter protein ClpS
VRCPAALRSKQKQKQTKKPPNYRVLLHNDSANKREYVVQVLLKARPRATSATLSRCARTPGAAAPSTPCRAPRHPHLARMRRPRPAPRASAAQLRRARVSLPRVACRPCQVVDGMTVERAYDIMQEAHQYGLALVLITVQEEAESICDALRSNGLVATVEPDSGGRGGGNDGGNGGD